MVSKTNSTFFEGTDDVLRQREVLNPDDDDDGDSV